MLFVVGDALMQFVEVLWGAEPGLAPDLLAEGFGQPPLQLGNPSGQAGAAFVGGEQVGVQGGSAGRRAAGRVLRDRACAACSCASRSR